MPPTAALTAASPEPLRKPRRDHHVGAFGIIIKLLDGPFLFHIILPVARQACIVRTEITRS
jgi:hypothetical protein